MVHNGISRRLSKIGLLNNDRSQNTTGRPISHNISHFIESAGSKFTLGDKEALRGPLELKEEGKRIDWTHHSAW